MKSIAFVSAVALIGAIFSVAANAQTGRPSAQEAHDTSAASPALVSDPEAGSYARYLMLNGTPRDEALQRARNVDHPVARQRAVNSVRAGADTGSAATPVRQ